MNKLARISATVASSLALVAGFSGVAGAASITDSGRDSWNQIKSVNVAKTHVDNDTNVRLSNENSQEATSGDANVHNNDDVRSVSTGDASNDNTTNNTVHVSSSTTSASTAPMSDSSSMGDATISDSGRDSSNQIKSVTVASTDVHNDTNICVTNNSEQSATSGDANVKNNDDVGNVSTGNASNTNSTTNDVTVSNTVN